MKCPECQFENKPDVELCKRCGVRLGPLPHIHSSSNRFEGEAADHSKEPSLPGSKASVSSGTGTSYFSSQIETEISPRTRIFIFFAVFYALLLSYLSVALVSPSNPYAQLAAVFQSFWANFLVLVFFLVVATFALYTVTCFCCKRVLKTSWGKPKLGKLLLRDGYVTKEELEEALQEQHLRIGQVLVLSGRLSEEQLAESLERQKQVSKKLGEVLIDLGFSTQSDIDWALHMIDRRLGEILRERGLLKGEDIEWLLGQQEFGRRSL
jgi:fumarate reductase subunit C